MLRVTGGLPISDRARTILLAIAAFVALSIAAPSAAHASGCTDSWTNTAGGSWFTGSNWSKGAPPTSEEEACITENGTYTVELTEESGSVNVKSLTVGGSSGTQALAIGSSCSDNTQFTTTAGIANGAHGALTLTNGDGCGDSVTVSGPISNAGTLTTEPDHGGSRTLQGNLTNTGTLAINVSTAYDDEGTTLTNEGTLNLAEGAQLKASGGASVTNGKGAKIAATGTGNVFVTGGMFTEGAGTTSGTLPAIVDDGTLAYNASGGASLIALRGASSLSGTSSSGQSLSMQSTCSENTVVTAAGGFTNGGTIYLTNGDGCGDSVTLDASGGLSSSGMIVSEPEHGGSRTVEGNLTNTGTLAINANTSYGATGTTLTNEGALDVATGKALTVAAKTTLTNGAGGSIAATGSGQVVAASGSTVNEGAGTTSGSEPVVADDAALNYTGAGASVISLRGTSSLSGSLVAGQSLAIQSTCGENATATAGTSFTNGGTTTLTNFEGCANNITLALSAGTLTNTGKLAVEQAHGGSRTLEGSLTNKGTVAIGANTAFNGKGAALQNEGALEVAESKQLTVSNGASVTNASGGSIAAGSGATVTIGSGTTFNEGAGTTSGGKPVIVDDGTLNYTGPGASQIDARGNSTLTGNLGAEQSLAIQSTCGENAFLTAGASFTNAGTITLTNGDSCGNGATFDLTSGTFTNSGRVTTEQANGGARTLQGNLTNTGTLAILATTAYNGASAVLANEGTLNIGEAKTLSVSNFASVANVSGTISTTGSGAVSLGSSTSFTEDAGTTSGTKPVIVDDGTLTYGAGGGKSQIGLRGSSALNGGLGASQSLTLESTCSENALATAGSSFTNVGTITLTNGDNCGNAATLDLTSGTLTNSGKIAIEPANGGGRTLEGNLTNSGSLSIKASTAYNGSSALLTNIGTINIAEGTTLAVSNNGSVTNGSGGNIVATGSAALTETGGTFTEGSGKTSGTVPVILDDSALKYAGTATEPGSGPIAARGSSTLSGRIRSGNALLIQSTCSENAVLTAATSFESYGTIELTNGDNCGDSSTLNVGTGTLTSGGTINVANPHGGGRTIDGNLVNKFTVSVAAGEKLQVSGAYTQASSARLKTFIASASEFGALSVGGAATLAGSVAIHQILPFRAAAGESFPILTSASLSGAFANELGEPQIKYPGLYYMPVYSSSGVKLVATLATMGLSATSGAPGATITISGSGYIPGDTITPTFIDHKGVNTEFASVTVNSSGEFSTEVIIPAGAAVGAGTLKATSKQTGIHISNTFKVT